MAGVLGNHRVTAKLDFEITEDRGEGQPTEFHKCKIESEWDYLSYRGVVALQGKVIGGPLELGVEKVNRLASQ